MRHVSVWSLGDALSVHLVAMEFPASTRACDWVVDPSADFVEPKYLLPDCPHCAVLLDLALELRSPAETESTNQTASQPEVTT